MYGDTSVIRGLAGRLRHQGAEIRAEADALVGAAEHVPWTGLTADAMRGLVREQAGGLRAAATQHERAADALERHAGEVDRRVALIAAIERRVAHLRDDALHGGRGLGASFGALGLVATQVAAPDALGDWARYFQPPPPGSREWLELDVPLSA